MHVSCVSYQYTCTSIESGVVFVWLVGFNSHFSYQVYLRHYLYHTSWIVPYNSYNYHGWLGPIYISIPRWIVVRCNHTADYTNQTGCFWATNTDYILDEALYHLHVTFCKCFLSHTLASMCVQVFSGGYASVKSCPSVFWRVQVRQKCESVY